MSKLEGGRRELAPLVPADYAQIGLALSRYERLICFHIARRRVLVLRQPYPTTIPTITESDYHVHVCAVPDTDLLCYWHVPVLILYAVPLVSLVMLR